MNERTSKRIASKAARVLASNKSTKEDKQIAASALTQREPKMIESVRVDGKRRVALIHATKKTTKNKIVRIVGGGVDLRIKVDEVHFFWDTSIDK
jgi:hypothetical protein